MQSTAFLLIEIVPFVIGDEVDHRAIRQRRRFVENQTPILDARAQWAHAPTVRRPIHGDKALTVVRASVISSAIPPGRAEDDGKQTKAA